MSDEYDPKAFQGLMERVDKLTSAVDRLSQARTPVQKEAAEEKVESAEEALEVYARAHGLSKAEAEDAINAVKRKQNKDTIRELIKEILDEEGDKLFSETTGGEKEEEEVEERKDEPPDPGKHWTEKKVFS